MSVRHIAVIGCFAAVGCGDDQATARDTEEGTGTSVDASTRSTGTDDPPDQGSSSDDTSSSSGDDTGPPAVDPEPAETDVAAGLGFSCSVSEGVLRCWGNNGCGQLGDGTNYGKAPVEVATDRTWASVAAGLQHTCAIEEGGALWCWGNGLDGKVGDGVINRLPPASNCRLDPVEIEPGTTWARVAPGRDHTCGVQTDGTLWCWGSNESGQIGDGSVGQLYTRLVPTLVAGDDWVDVVAGGKHSCGLRSDGSVWCWGAGAVLDAANVSFSSTPVWIELPVSIRALGRGNAVDYTCAIDENGGVWCWGVASLGQTGTMGDETLPHGVELRGPVAEIATHAATTCARRQDGVVLCFGSGGSGQLGDGVAMSGHRSPDPLPVPLPSGAVSISVGSQHACARTDDGVVRCWGRNSFGEIGDGTSGPDNARLTPTPAVPWGGGPVAQGWDGVSVGEAGTCAVRDGTLWCWGQRARGALGNGDPADDCSPNNPVDCLVTTPRAVLAAGTWSTPTVGRAYACAIADDGTLWCWGRNGAGQLGTGDVDDALVPVQVGTAGDWMTVAAGDATTCGIRSPGTLWCWGANDFGMLGNDSEGGFSPTPTAVGVDEDWVQVSPGRFHVCGIRSGGQLSCWGRNLWGQLGHGTEGDPVLTPTPVNGTWSFVATAEAHTCAIAATGTLSCWGSNNGGQVGPDAAQTATMPVQVGASSDWVGLALVNTASCGLRSDGTAWCWGRNNQGQVGNGMVEPGTTISDPTQVVGLTDLTAISGGDNTMCGLGADGVAWCWGGNAGRRGDDTIFISGMATEVRDDD